VKSGSQFSIKTPQVEKMGSLTSRQNAGVEEVDVSSNHAYKYPPRSGISKTFASLCIIIDPDLKFIYRYQHELKFQAITSVATLLWEARDSTHLSQRPTFLVKTPT
jgi:hypothetical protein